MSERILITSLKSILPIKTPFIAAIRKIFFDTTTRKSFDGEKDKKDFFDKWTAYYLDHYPEDVLMAFNEKDRLMAYLTGCRESAAATDILKSRIESYMLFEDQFEEFPAHLHINTAPEYQGKGVGGVILEEFINNLMESNIKGVHIVTSGDSRNVSFYRRYGFDVEIEREFNGSKLRFMGRKLT